jgi:DNA-binding transcriptional regulator YhcF (GntR family)
MLSARDVEEALKERLLRGAYPRGGALPSVRALAAELGTSPSTVGRAVQELARQGWVTATSRRGAVVRRDLPDGETGVRDAEAAIRRLAVRWRLVGGDRSEFQELVARVADEVFQPAPRTVFLECNPVDLQRGLEQVQAETSMPVEPLLLEQAAALSKELKDVNVVLTPYFHLAEARRLAPDGAQVVPLNFVASEEAMRVLLELAPDTLVGVLALDARRRRLLEAIVHQYSAAAVLGALYDDPEAAGLVEAADLVLVTNAAELPGHLASRARRLVRVGWALEPGGLAGWRVGAEPARWPARVPGRGGPKAAGGSRSAPTTAQG